MTADTPYDNAIAEPFVIDPAPDADGPVRIEASRAGAVVITLARPEAQNRLTQALAGALREAFETLHGADHVRIAFVRGAGGHFCAGRDPQWLRDSADWTESDLREDARDLAHALKALRGAPALTVALVQGEAFGPGFGLAAACDLIVATPDARFGFPEIKLGLLPAIPAPYVVEALGARRASVLMQTGRLLDAQEALALGLVSEIVPDAAGFDAVMHRLAAEARGAAPNAAVAAKRLAWRVAGHALDHGLTDELARAFAAQRASDEGVEGVKAFLDGSAATWNN